MLANMESLQATGVHGLAEQAMQIRALELLLLELYRENKLFGTVHTCVGQEFCASCLHPHLDPERDVFVGSHRSHGHYLAFGGPLRPFLAELMGRQGALCQGRGGTQHLCFQRFFTSGIQAGGSLWATGLAWAQKLQGQKGGLTVVQLGDGTLGEGALYEAFTFAALLKAPILFYLEWNGCAQSTDTSTTTPGDILTRARGFGLEAHRHADQRPQELFEHLGSVVERVRLGVPTLQIVDTQRLLAHSKGDDPRTEEELARLWQNDPLSRYLEDEPGAQQRYQEISQRLAEEARQVDLWPAVSPGSDGALAPMEGELCSSDLCRESHTMVVESLNQQLHSLMQDDGRIVLLGEDIADPYGGAFKVTRGLSTRFPQRVFSTPIAEAAIVGTGNGLALAGMRPIAEVMFADFATLACDQMINHAAKFRYMYGGRFGCPLLLRLVSGGGRGYGPTHSQSMENLFFGIAGLRILALSRRHNAGDLLGRILSQSQDPTILVEHKRLYAQRQAVSPPLDLTFQETRAHNGDFPSLYYQASMPQVTLVSYGGCADIVEEAVTDLFIEHEINCDFIVLTQLWPLVVDEVLHSVARSGRLLVVEEGNADYGVGAAVLAKVAGSLAFRGRALGAQVTPIPSARHLEQEALPGPRRVVESVLELL